MSMLVNFMRTYCEPKATQGLDAGYCLRQLNQYGTLSKTTAINKEIRSNNIMSGNYENPYPHLARLLNKSDDLRAKMFFENSVEAIETVDCKAAKTKKEVEHCEEMKKDLQRYLSNREKFTAIMDDLEGVDDDN